MTDQEEWRPVPGFPDYMVSSEGRVASIKRGGFRVLTGGASVSGYRNVLLYSSGARTMRRVHTLVAEAFHGPRPAGLEVRHLDGDMLNNAAANLRWGTHEENLEDMRRHRGRLLIIGDDPVPTRFTRPGHCPQNHERTEQNTYRYPDGRAVCRPCMSARSAASRTRRNLAAANIKTTETAA